MPIQKIQSFLARRERRTELRAHVAALEEARFEDYRCVVQAGLSRLFVSNGPGGAPEVRVPADFVLDLEEAAADRAVSVLSAAGFALGTGSSGLEWTRAERRLVADVEEVLFDGLGISPGVLYSVAVEPDRSADNPELRRAMRSLAEGRSLEARKDVYRALVESTLLLAVDRSDGGLRPLADEEDLGDRRTWLAFSGPQALGEHERSFEHVSVSGLRLVRAALEKGAGALRLDFGSPVGGELYANELRTIAESIPAARPAGFQ